VITVIALKPTISLGIFSRQKKFGNFFKARDVISHEKNLPATVTYFDKKKIID